MTDELLEHTMQCVDLVQSALDGSRETEYIESLKQLIPLVRVASDEVIDSLPFAVNIRSSFRTDQKLMKSAVTEEKDQVSMLSTLVTYIECNQEGMPEHSREYMDRVTKLRPGDSTEVRNISIEAVPAYNINKPMHRKKSGWLGYVITIDGVRLYDAGDCDAIPEGESVDADIRVVTKLSF